MLRLPGEAMFDFGEHLVTDAANIAAEEVLDRDGMHDHFAWR